MPLETTATPFTPRLTAKGRRPGRRRRAGYPRRPGNAALERRLRGGSGAERHRRAPASMESHGYDLVLLDLMMPDRSGMEVLREVRARDRETPIFMITAYGSVEAAVEALKLGANDYFSKPWDNEKLLIEIDRMIARRRLEYENTHLKRALKQRYSFPNIIGKSERMVRMLDLVAQVASSRSTILITGETGTGKELIAKAIHANSPRADQLFVAVNSGSLPPDLLESTLVRPREGRLHQRHSIQEGLLRSRRPRHHLLRRDRHHRPGDADQAAARDSGKGVHPAGLDRPHQSGRAHPRRHQRRPAPAGQGRQVPRGPLLPAQRDQHRAAAAARAQGRHPAAGGSLLQRTTAARTTSFWTRPAAPCCTSSRRRCRC